MSQNARDRAIALLIVALVVGSTVFAFMQAIGDLPTATLTEMPQ